MTVRHVFLLAATLGLLLGGTACGDRDAATLGPETDEPLFVQGKQLEKQGRHPEALNAFLKLIDRRGERASAESHLEAGLICLNHTKDPIEACHHFRKYLELQPNSKEAPYVRGMVDVARREFARTLSARPLEDQSFRLEIAEEVSKLRRENEELRAELAARRGIAPMPVRSSVITVPDFAGSKAVSPPVAAIADSPITPAPVRSATLGAGSLVQPAPARTQATMAQTTPARPNLGSQPAGKANKTHTVAVGDTFYKLSKQYGVTIEDLAAANGMKVTSTLKLGTVLKIPAAPPR
jgi:LysM repeat protein